MYIYTYTYSQGSAGSNKEGGPNKEGGLYIGQREGLNM